MSQWSVPPYPPALQYGGNNVVTSYFRSHRAPSHLYCAQRFFGKKKKHIKNCMHLFLASFIFYAVFDQFFAK